MTVYNNKQELQKYNNETRIIENESTVIRISLNEGWC